MSAAVAAPAIDKSLEGAFLVARIADDFKGKNTVLIDMQSITPYADYYVITTANSPRQMSAMAIEMGKVLKKRGGVRIGTEGDYAGSMWMLSDFGDIVLHAFTEEGRALYDLEGLWADAPRLEWREPGRPVRVGLTDDYDDYASSAVMNFDPDEDEGDEIEDELDEELEGEDDELDDELEDDGEDELEDKVGDESEPESH